MIIILTKRDYIKEFDENENALRFDHFYYPSYGGSEIGHVPKVIAKQLYEILYDDSAREKYKPNFLNVDTAFLIAFMKDAKEVYRVDLRAGYEYPDVRVIFLDGDDCSFTETYGYSVDISDNAPNGYEYSILITIDKVIFYDTDMDNDEVFAHLMSKIILSILLYMYQGKEIFDHIYKNDGIVVFDSNSYSKDEVGACVAKQYHLFSLSAYASLLFDAYNIFCDLFGNDSKYLNILFDLFYRFNPDTEMLKDYRREFLNIINQENLSIVRKYTIINNAEILNFIYDKFSNLCKEINKQLNICGGDIYD